MDQGVQARPEFSRRGSFSRTEGAVYVPFLKSGWPDSSELLILGSCRRLRVGIGRLSSYLLAFELLGQLTLEALPFSGFQKVGVFLHFLDNAFLLHLSFETPERALNRFTIENPDLSQSMPP